MNRLFTSAILLGITLIIGCDDKVVDEPVGYSDFLATNQLNQPIVIKVYAHPQVLEFELAQSTTATLFENVGGDFGIHAYPEEFLDSIEIYSAPNSELIKTYKEISRDDWSHQTPEGYVYWQRAIYTLEVDTEFLAN